MRRRDLREGASNEIWLLLPSGDKAILSAPGEYWFYGSDGDDDFREGVRTATIEEICTPHLGRVFPWDSHCDDNKAKRLWRQFKLETLESVMQRRYTNSKPFKREHRITGSLAHRWILEDSFPRIMKYPMIKDVPAKNIGFSFALQTFATENVNLHEGGIIATPLFEENKAMVDFVGYRGFNDPRPDPKPVLFDRLQEAMPKYQLSLLPSYY